VSHSYLDKLFDAVSEGFDNCQHTVNHQSGSMKLLEV